MRGLTLAPGQDLRWLWTLDGSGSATMPASGVEGITWTRQLTASTGFDRATIEVLQLPTANSGNLSALQNREFALQLLAADGTVLGQSGEIKPRVLPRSREITWLVGQGITQGYVDGSFGVAKPTTRQAFAAFLHRRLS